jgi:hypothetical protein
MSVPRPEDSQEEWRAIAGHPGYEVSDMGNVRTSDLFDSAGRLAVRSVPVAQCLTRSGGRNNKWRVAYWEVSLRRLDQKDFRDRARRKVHHLVLENFHGPRPPRMVGCHGPGGELDNRSSNLRWDTQRANIEDMHRARGGHHNSLLTECLNGHDITNPDNVYTNARGRKCKTCQRKRTSDRYHRDHPEAPYKPR